MAGIHSLFDQRVWVPSLLAVLMVCALATWLVGVRGQRSLARLTRGLESAKPVLDASQGAEQGFGQGIEVGVGETDSTPSDATEASLANPHLYATALHEAAHALYYGVSPEGVPQSLYAEVYRDVGANGVLGGVGHYEGNPEGLSESFLLWHMRKDVAGTEAQWVVFGERYAGGSTDSELWLDCAICYLRSGLGEVFYLETPSGNLTAPQLAHNRAVLNTLREQCQNDARQFLTSNQEVLLDLAEELTQRLRMEANDLAPFLARVRQPQVWETR